MSTGGWLGVTVGPVQLRHEAPKEVDLAVASFIALASPTSVGVVLNKGDAVPDRRSRRLESGVAFSVEGGDTLGA
jgi:hypothetical protein